MSVILRKRKNSDGSTTLLLDVWHNGKRSYEFLKECKLTNSRQPAARLKDKEKLALAEEIKAKRAHEIQCGEYGITPKFKKDIDFLQYFDNYLIKYSKKDRRVMNGCFGKFKLFLSLVEIKKLNANQLDENLVEDFKTYLEETMNGETPANYFKKFKKVLKQGVKDKIIQVNPAADLTAKRNEGIKKEILTFDEIQLLAEAHCNNNEVKRAFLFSCLTGLRFCDITALKWKNINGKILKVQQQKTAKDVTININDNAIDLLGKSDKAEVLVFNLPSHTACLKGLQTWCKAAGIQKKITWHCARHSFATNIIFYGSDVNSASSLLGHSSLIYTQRYLRVANDLKEKAVQNLPHLSL